MLCEYSDGNSVRDGLKRQCSTVGEALGLSKCCGWIGVACSAKCYKRTQRLRLGSRYKSTAQSSAA
jgi:hypothetical protein